MYASIVKDIGSKVRQELENVK